MIFVLEMPAQAEPKAWFAYDADDLLRKVAAGDALQAWEIHDRATPRELLEMFDAAPETPGVHGRYPGICAMGEEYGWDTPLYRADHLLEPGTYRTGLVTPAQASEAALRARGDCRIYWSESEATAAFERAEDPAWTGGGWRARWALRAQLVATEVLADDL
ncbi:hypothetical protein [Azohydromonas caseinilytica]|uniref:Uncharacterized protein n=1 Tax=Azohydromonas caseinilytica TaxID=2728836 RepID=A0A848F9Z9_9BURK|nr:hypothetical protein [Azohydromonas caseinilytica]NML16152.1 hypothetical protein [Azohydromonas caseinilytica]